MYEKFKELCSRKGVKTADVSRATGISQSTFSHWKKGDYAPNGDKMNKIAKFFGVDVDYFYLDEAIKEHNESVEGMTAYDYIYGLVSDYMDYLLIEMSKHKYSEDDIKEITRFAKYVGERDKDGNEEEHKD